MNPRLTTLLNLLVGVIAILLIGSAIYTSQTTGFLSISSPDKNAVITISQDEHEAKVIGVGSAKVHLNQGFYQIAASDNGKQQFDSVQINKKQTLTKTLNPTQPVSLPSVETINFMGFDSLTEHGLSNDQLGLVKQDFFEFKPVAKTVSINASSIKPGPHDPNTSVGFTLVFKVSVDSSQYTANASYVGLSDLRLSLYDSQNKLVFDSGQNP